MNAWGFVAAAIVPTLAPVIADRFSWSSVIIVNAAVAVLGIVAFLLTATNKPLESGLRAPGKLGTALVTGFARKGSWRVAVVAGTLPAVQAEGWCARRRRAGSPAGRARV
jgi:hypothetical protein